MNNLVKKNLEIKGNINKLIVFNTQNQIVNYVVAKIFFELSDKANFKVFAVSENKKNSPHNKQNEWYENLAAVLEKEKFNIEKSEIDTRELKRGNDILYMILSEKLTSKEAVLWNITGGQRHLLMQVLICIIENKRKDDVILYFEGNKNEIHKYNFYEIINDKTKETSFDLIKTVNDLKINLFNDKKDSEKLFRLLGFEDVKIDKNSTIYFTEGEMSQEQKIIYKFYKTVNDYLEECEIKDRLNFICEYKKLFTLTSDENKEKYNTTVKNIKDKFIEICKDKFIEICKDKRSVNIIDDELSLKDKDKDKNKNKICDFGKFFEKMVYYKIVEILESEENLKSKVLYVELDFSIKDEKISSVELDQIDVLIFLKSGRLIVIECKVGSAGSDNSKANKFTTYNLSGVYGLPLLVVPHYFDEDTLSVSTSEKYKEIIEPYTNTKDIKDIYESMKSIDSIVNQAIRCKLPFTTMNTERFTDVLKYYIG